MITTDFQLFGALCLILGGIFYTSSLPQAFWRWFYRFIPVMVACYFLPSLLNTFHLIQVPDSRLPDLAVDYLMPICLVLLLIGMDLGRTLKQGRQLLLLFFVGSLGVLIGAPVAYLTVAALKPELFVATGADSVWRGMATLAGNWVGGTANQLAMKELFSTGDSIFGVFVTVNVIVSGLWMALLLALAPHEASINRWLKSRDPKIALIGTEAAPQLMPGTRHWIALICLPLALGGVAHLLASWTSAQVIYYWPNAEVYHLDAPFIWMVLWLTLLSILLSFTRAKKLMQYGAERVANLCLYIMLAIMGLKMDIAMLLALPWYFAIGMIWLTVHVAVMLLVTRLLRMPFAWMAIASQCNLGGAASAPVVTTAYRPELVPLAVLIAVFGYAWANLVGWACGQWLSEL